MARQTRQVGVPTGRQRKGMARQNAAGTLRKRRIVIQIGGPSRTRHPTTPRATQGRVPTAAPRQQ